jgi:hypothetical protein
VQNEEQKLAEDKQNKAQFFSHDLHSGLRELITVARHVMMVFQFRITLGK